MAPDELRTTRELARSLVREALGLDSSTVRPAGPVHPGRRPARGWPRWTLPTMLAAVAAFQARTGRAPRPEDFRTATAQGLPGRAAVISHVGSVPTLLRLARAQPILPGEDAPSQPRDG